MLRRWILSRGSLGVAHRKIIVASSEMQTTRDSMASRRGFVTLVCAQYTIIANSWRGSCIIPRDQEIAQLCI